MPRTMCGISRRSRSGTSLHSPCPNEAMTRDRDTPHAPACRSVWHGIQRVIPSSLRGSAGAWVLRVTSSKERTRSHPAPSNVDPSRLTATRSPREVRNVWMRVRVPIVADHCARIRSRPEGCSRQQKQRHTAWSEVHRLHPARTLDNLVYFPRMTSKKASITASATFGHLQQQVLSTNSHFLSR